MANSIMADSHVGINVNEIYHLPRGRYKQTTNFSKNVNIWNHYEKCIQISTNMPDIDASIREINVKMSEI